MHLLLALRRGGNVKRHIPVTVKSARPFYNTPTTRHQPRATASEAAPEPGHALARSSTSNRRARLRAVRTTALLLEYKHCESETDDHVDALLACSLRNTGETPNFERSGRMTGSIPSWVLSRALDVTDSQS